MKIAIVDDSIKDGTDTTPVFTWKAPSEGEDSALLLELAADDSSFTFTGSGKTADGLLNGDYILAVNGTETVDINVENLETKPEKAGYYNGTFNNCTKSSQHICCRGICIIFCAFSCF